MKTVSDNDKPMLFALSLFPEYWSKDQLECWRKWAKAKYQEMIAKGLHPKQSDFMGS